MLKGLIAHHTPIGKVLDHKIECCIPLAQNFFTCLPAIAGREAFAMLEKPGFFRQGGLGKTAKVSGYQLVPRGGPRVYALGGAEGHRERHFAQRNCLFSLQHSLGQSCPEGLVAGSQPARHKEGG